jgi:hypothetical protein
MKPMPMGRVFGGVEGMGELRRREDASSRCVERVETSVPAPMNPMPPGSLVCSVYREATRDSYSNPELRECSGDEKEMYVVDISL